MWFVMGQRALVSERELREVGVCRPLYLPGEGGGGCQDADERDVGLGVEARVVIELACRHEEPTAA